MELHRGLFWMLCPLMSVEFVSDWYLSEASYSKCLLKLFESVDIKIILIKVVPSVTLDQQIWMGYIGLDKSCFGKMDLSYAAELSLPDCYFISVCLNEAWSTFTTSVDHFKTKVEMWICKRGLQIWFVCKEWHAVSVDEAFTGCLSFESLSPQWLHSLLFATQR